MASKNVETFRSAHQAFNRRDFDALVSAVAPGFVYRDRARGLAFAGADGFQEFARGWTTAMSNAEVFEPAYLDAGDVVVAEFTGRGVNDGPLGPLAPTGKQMNLRFCEVARFDADGRIASIALYYDQVSLLTQLGHWQPAVA